MTTIPFLPVAIAAVLCCALAGTAAAQGVPAHPSSTETAYAAARKTCLRQGKRVRLTAIQTNDKLLSTEGVTVGFECAVVARAIRPRSPTAARSPAARRAARASR